jgi:hypothetical protein
MQVENVCVVQSAKEQKYVSSACHSISVNTAGELQILKSAVVTVVSISVVYGDISHVQLVPLS